MPEDYCYSFDSENIMKLAAIANQYDRYEQLKSQGYNTLTQNDCFSNLDSLNDMRKTHHQKEELFVIDSYIESVKEILLKEFNIAA